MAGALPASGLVAWCGFLNAVKLALQELTTAGDPAEAAR
jgi:hypothetical protein